MRVDKSMRGKADGGASLLKVYQTPTASPDDVITL
jgi:hypothetical protein